MKDVVPALTTNAEGLKKVLDDLVKQYKSKQEELEKWKVCTTRFRAPALNATAALSGTQNLTVAACYRRRTISRLFSPEVTRRLESAGEGRWCRAMSPRGTVTSDGLRLHVFRSEIFIWAPNVRFLV